MNLTMFADLIDQGAAVTEKATEVYFERNSRRHAATCAIGAACWAMGVRPDGNSMNAPASLRRFLNTIIELPADARERYALDDEPATIFTSVTKMNDDRGVRRTDIARVLRRAKVVA